MSDQKNISKHHQQGLTLIELIATLAITGILLAYGAPAMHDFYANNRLSIQTQQFGQLLIFARSEAIKRNENVVVCTADESNQCNKTKQWNNQWLVFEDKNHNTEWDGKETRLKRINMSDNPVNIQSSRKSVITFYSHGKSPGSNATFTFCDSRGEDFARAVILSNSGRYRIGNKKSSGETLTCD